jgi:hypothetical protein
VPFLREPSKAPFGLGIPSDTPELGESHIVVALVMQQQRQADPGCNTRPLRKCREHIALPVLHCLCSTPAQGVHASPAPSIKQQSAAHFEQGCRAWHGHIDQPEYLRKATQHGRQRIAGLVKIILKCDQVFARDQSWPEGLKEAHHVRVLLRCVDNKDFDRSTIPFEVG